MHKAAGTISVAFSVIVFSWFLVLFFSLSSDLNFFSFSELFLVAGLGIIHEVEAMCIYTSFDCNIS